MDVDRHAYQAGNADPIKISTAILSLLLNISAI
jgi:hypothetical protein